MKGQYYPQQNQTNPMILLALGIGCFFGILFLWIIPDYVADTLNSTEVFASADIANAKVQYNTIRIIGTMLCLVGLIWVGLNIRR